MTPKEKASQLINKFYYSIVGVPADINVENAKRCAIEAVDEILSLDINAKTEIEFNVERKIEEYWQQVKDELNK